MKYSKHTTEPKSRLGCGLLTDFSLRQSPYLLHKMHKLSMFGGMCKENPKIFKDAFTKTATVPSRNITQLEDKNPRIQVAQCFLPYVLTYLNLKK